MINLKKIRKTNQKEKKLTLLGIIILIITATTTCTFLFLSSPKLEIEKSTLTFSYNEEIILPKYRAYAMNKDISNKVKIKNEVKKHKVGKYFVTYQIKTPTANLKKLVLVKIIDPKKPVITLKGEKEVFLCPNTTYQEDGFQAIDEYDGNITKKVRTKTEEDKIVYQVEDSSHNKTEVERKIYHEDKTPPTITLKGQNKIYLSINSTYQEPGYVVEDNCDKNIDVDVNGEVNTKKLGSYTITYSATDSSNNNATITRTIEVINKPQNEKGTIYLTFDDGPSNTVTPKILNILKEKGIPATFFVINHDDSLNNLIKREYQEGHTVALHSYTHTYSIVYQSIDSYFNDLNQIRDKVYKITGEYSNIIRFPGGSSNTVSKRFNKGIMSNLVNEVNNKGFHYFDWNIDCGDGAGIKDANKIYNNVTTGLSPNRENVVLMHDFENNYGTLNALSEIIDYGIKEGYQFKKITMDTMEVHHRPNN